MIKLANLLAFIVAAQEDGWKPEVIVSQIKLYAEGVRDGRMSDMTLIHLDRSSHLQGWAESLLAVSAEEQHLDTGDAVEFLKAFTGGA